MRWLFTVIFVMLAVAMPRAQVSTAPVEDPVIATSPDAGVAVTPDEQIGRFFDRYLWFIPQAPGHKASLGVGIFILIASLIMLGARMANLDGVTFGRAAVMSTIVMVVALLELALLPESMPLLVAALVLDLVLWFVAVRILLDGDLFNAGVIGVCFVFAVVVGILGLEVGGTLMQRSELLG